MSLLGKKILFGILISVFLMTPGSSVFAYVLSGSQLLELVVKNIGTTKKIEITQRLIVYDDKLEAGAIELDEKVNYLFPEFFRSEIISKDTKKIHIASSDKTLMILDGEIASESESGFDHYKDLLALKNRMVLQKRLQRLGLDTSKTRLERKEGQIVYVIGQKESYGELYPLLYIDKKSFLPVSWVIRGTTLSGEVTQPLEVVYHDWKKYKRIKVPTKIEFYRNHVLVREIRVEKVGLNSGIHQGLFDFEALKAECLAAKEEKVKAEKNEEKSDARKTIDGLDQIIENDRLAF